MCKWPSCDFEGPSRKDNLLRHIRTTRSESDVKKGGNVTNAAKEGADLRFVYGESLQMRKEAGKIIAVLRAVDGGNIAALEILLPQGEDITETTDSGKTALHIAASNGCIEWGLGNDRVPSQENPRS